MRAIRIEQSRTGQSHFSFSIHIGDGSLHGIIEDYRVRIQKENVIARAVRKGNVIGLGGPQVFRVGNGLNPGEFGLDHLKGAIC